MSAPTRQVVLVTGVSRSIGIAAAVAQRQLDEGWAVYASGWTAHDRAMPWGEDELPSSLLNHEHFELVEADLADPAAAAELVSGAVARFGRLDALIAAHARSSSGGLFEVTVEELDACWRVNARSSLLLTRAFAEQLPPARDGRVVLFTSGQHIGPMDGEIAYAVSKGAIHQMTASLANAVADRRIRVNTINPGPVDTGYLTGDDHAQVASMFPDGRWGQPSDIAGAAAWLLSDDGAWITGQVLDIEGGFRRWR